jgi:hypothetical protein
MAARRAVPAAASSTSQPVVRSSQPRAVYIYRQRGTRSAGAGEPLIVSSRPTYFLAASYVLLVAGAIYALPSSSALRPPAVHKRQIA